MKRIYNSDIRFNITGLNLPESYDFTFYTVDENVNIKKDETDAYEESGNTYIALDWSVLQLLGEGSMSYKLTKHIPDPEFPDRTYDSEITRITNYYIVSDVQPIPSGESASTLEIIINLIDGYEENMEQMLALEAYDRTQADQQLQTEVSGLTGRVEALEGQDFSGFATKVELESGVTDAKAYAAERDTIVLAAAKDYADSKTESMATKTWVEEQGYLTQHQDLTGYLTRSDYNIDKNHMASKDWTQQYLEAEGYATKDYVEQAIEGGVDLSNYYQKSETYSKTEVDEKISEISTDTYATKAEVNETSAATINAIEEKGYITGYTETDPVFEASAAANITSENINTWNNKSDFSGSYNDLTDKPTIPTVPTDVSAFNNDAGYLTEHQSLDDYYTKEQVDEAIEHVDVSGQLINYATTAVTDDLQTQINGKQDKGNYVSASTLNNYYTSAQTDTLLEGKQPTGDYALKSDVTSAVTAVSGELQTEINGKQDAGNYVSASTLGNYYTSAQTDTLLAGKQPTGDYATRSELPDITPYIDGVVYSSTTKTINFYHDTTLVAQVDATDFIKDGMVTNVAIVSGNLVITFNTDAGQEPISIPLTDIFNPANYYTSAETASAIETASGNTIDWVKNQNYLTEHQSLTDYALKTDVISADTATSGATIDWVKSQNYLTEHQSLANYYTSAETDNAISTATNDMATQTWVGEQGYLTEHQDISGKADISDVNSALTEVNTAIEGKQDKGNYVSASTLGDYYTSAQTDQLLSGKQATGDYALKSDVTSADTAVSGATIDWVKSQNYLTEHQSLDDYYTSAQTDTKIATASGLTVTWVIDQHYLTEHQSLDDYYTSAQTDQKIHEATSAITVDLTDYYTSAQTNTAINNATSGKTDKSVFDTHTGNTTVHITAEERTSWNAKSNFSGDYNDLTNKPTIPTVPTNVSAFNNDAGYLTQHQSLADYYTSAQTNNAINEATSAISGNDVVELTQAEYEALTAVSENTMYIITDTSAFTPTDYYTSAVTDTRYVQASSGVTGYDGAYVIRIMTQAAYDALSPNYDNNTIYIIQG